MEVFLRSYPVIAFVIALILAILTFDIRSGTVARDQTGPTNEIVPTGAFLVNFESQGIHPKHLDAHVQYVFSSMERYFIYVPSAIPHRTAIA